jgi:NCS1 family nucleobase:cation symporter-1
VPWTAVNLVDYYLVQHGDYVVDDFFRADGGRYGRVNWVAIAAYLLGIGVQVPFIVTTLYTGPVGSALNGVDLSWIVGLVVVTPVYYVAAKRFRSTRSRASQDAGLVSAGPAEEVA